MHRRSYKKTLFVGGVLLVVALQTPLAASTKLSSKKLEPITLKHLPLKGDTIKDFVDSHGRQRIFHGTNAVVKGPPYLPDRLSGFSTNTSLVADDFWYMQRAGLNVLRLGFMWPGAEPERGGYNETYFAEYLRIVQEAAEYGKDR